jgi:hypothetical protein
MLPDSEKAFNHQRLKLEEVLRSRTAHDVNELLGQLEHGFLKVHISWCV